MKIIRIVPLRPHTYEVVLAGVSGEQAVVLADALKDKSFVRVSVEEDYR